MLNLRRFFSVTVLTGAAMLVTSMVSAGEYGANSQDIVDTAVSNGQFSTLAKALQAGGLIGTLKSDGPFTVFAPTDAAFAKLPQGTLQSLLAPENREQLIALLTYHVVPGKVTAADVVKLSSARTASGNDVHVAVNDGSVKINDSTVIKADVMASNGVIHVIDTVLLPNS